MLPTLRTWHEKPGSGRPGASVSGLRDNGRVPLEASLSYRALLWSLRLARAGFAFGAAVILPVLILRATGLIVLVQIGFAEAFAACAAAALAFVASLPRATGALLDEPRTLGQSCRRGGRVGARGPARSRVVTLRHMNGGWSSVSVGGT
jgi:hypothetical protein